MQELSASAQNPTPLTRYLDRSLMNVREQRNKGRMMPPRFLRKDEFSFIARHAPLVSIDLIIRDPEENVLVGLRSNEPARGTYFVPGGVIRKNETIEQACTRILAAEVGVAAPYTDATFRGVFEHFYDESAFDSDSGTHYVVIAHEFALDHRPAVVKDEQHSDMRWMSVADLLSAANVHANTKAYFR
jgi:colanic acid biosynthesis protein WcaH